MSQRSVQHLGIVQTLDFNLDLGQEVTTYLITCMGFYRRCRALLSIFLNKILSHLFQSWKYVVKGPYSEMYSTGFITLVYLSYLVGCWFFCGSGQKKVYGNSGWNAALENLGGWACVFCQNGNDGCTVDLYTSESVAVGIRRWQVQSLTHHHIRSVALLCLTSFW